MPPGHMQGQAVPFGGGMMQTGSIMNQLNPTSNHMGEHVENNFEFLVS